jgi:hypothetical protein
MNRQQSNDEDFGQDFSIDAGRESQRRITNKRTKPANYSRGGRGPTVFNGIHRRRRKKWTW